MMESLEARLLRVLWHSLPTTGAPSRSRWRNTKVCYHYSISTSGPLWVTFMACFIFPLHLLEKKKKTTRRIKEKCYPLKKWNFLPLWLVPTYLIVSKGITVMLNEFDEPSNPGCIFFCFTPAILRVIFLKQALKIWSLALGYQQWSCWTVEDKEAGVFWVVTIIKCHCSVVVLVIGYCLAFPFLRKEVGCVVVSGILDISISDIFQLSQYWKEFLVSQAFCLFYFSVLKGG